MAGMGAMACLLLCIAGGCTVPGALPSACGDGFVNAGEECDDKEMSAACDSDCTLPVCGDGLVNGEAGEECDIEGSSPSCHEDCAVASCGDGRVNLMAGETCDDGNATGGDGCSADCRLESCGNGTLDTGEVCDDGNTAGGDGCSAGCRLESCGNGTLEPGESCDDNGASATCDDDCTPVACGDGVVNEAAAEECDTGGDSATCDADCTDPWCGDGTINPIAGEECDTAGMSATCDDDCTGRECGDGVINTVAGEACDASRVDTVSCDHDCTAVVCGDGLVNAAAGEQCDTAGESGFCDADCTDPWCGDGEVNAMAGEECDDGNEVDGDGCSSACLLADPGTPLWSRRFGGMGGDYGTSIAVDSAGNVLLTGYFTGTADFGGGPLSSVGGEDVFAVALDPQGLHLWSRRFGGTGDDRVRAIAVDSAGNVLLTGYFTGTADFGGGPLSSVGGEDIFAVKLAPQGLHLWSGRFGGTGHDFGDAIAVDSAGNVLLTGHFTGTADFGGGPLSSAGHYDVFAVALDPQGLHLWSRRFGGAQADHGTAIAVDSAGNVLLTGHFRAAVNFGGGPLSSAGDSDIFAVELDAQGQHLWSRRLGGTSSDYGLGIAVDSAGDVLLTGHFQGTADFGGGLLSSAGDYDVFAVELDPQGLHLWSRRFGGTGDDRVRAIAVDSTGNVLLTGSFHGTVDFGGGPLSSRAGFDAFAVKLDSQGQHLWSRRFGGTSDDAGLGIAVDSAGNVLLTGDFRGTVDFGGGPLTSAGAEDIFTAKLSP